MNRIIKFRYWNTITNQMVNNPQMPHKEDWTIEQLFEERGWVWQQFTGLLDKNGKEIYEGDVVKVEDFSGGAYFGAPQPTVNQKVYYNTERGKYPFHGTGGFISKRTEIIGNIHENPELLK